jgi:hypothetical protein
MKTEKKKLNNADNSPVKVTQVDKHKVEAKRKDITNNRKGFVGSSPVKTKGNNKVHVTATTNGILLLRTEKPFSKEDAFTNTFSELLLKEPDYAADLNIQKVCDRRESPYKNNPIITPRGWNSKQYLSIHAVSDAENVVYRRKWAQNIVEALNKVDWTWGQSFLFCGDETLTPIGKMDKYLLNQDLAGVLGAYIFEDVEEVLSDTAELENIFGVEENMTNASSILRQNWTAWTTPTTN